MHETALDELLDRYDRGMSTRDLAATYHLTEAAVRSILKLSGRKLRRGAPGIPPSELPVVVELYEDGEPVEDIAAVYGVTDSTVRNVLNATGIRLRRGTRGEKNTRSRLTEADVIEIRRRYAERESLQSIADDYGLTREGIRHAATGMTWSHVPGALPPRRITNEQVTEIRDRYRDGASIRDLADDYGVLPTTIRDAITGATYSDVPDPVKLRPRGVAGLPDDQVIEARRRYADGESLMKLGADYGFDEESIKRLINGEARPDLPGATTIRSKSEQVRMSARGPGVKLHVLTEDQVIDMRHRYAEGATLNGLADEAGLSRATVRAAVTGVTWKHLPGAVRKRPGRNGDTPSVSSE